MCDRLDIWHCAKNKLAGDGWRWHIVQKIQAVNENLTTILDMYLYTYQVLNMCM